MRFGLFARSVGGGLGTSPLDGCEHSEGRCGPHIAVDGNLPKRQDCFPVITLTRDKNITVWQTNLGFSGTSGARDVEHIPLGRP